ncbi:hypothetical protein JS561_03130 [Salmonella enterica subsp. enterica serovar Infantis]|nr:hypothetical protein JS561_03130 [Salmonella enterica subsp. enterica serovar Infantis]
MYFRAANRVINDDITPCESTCFTCHVFISVLSGNDGLKGNIEEVTAFFGLDGGNSADWLHRDDALSLVVVDHRTADCISAVFNFVNIAVVLF